MLLGSCISADLSAFIACSYLDATRIVSRKAVLVSRKTTDLTLALALGLVCSLLPRSLLPAARGAAARGEGGGGVPSPRGTRGVAALSLRASSPPRGREVSLAGVLDVPCATL